MSTSLLLALLEAHEYNESDRTKDYYQWIGAQWDGKEWINGSPERQDLMLRELYDVLHFTIYASLDVTMPANGLGSVLARTLTDDPSAGLPETAKRLRATLRPEMLRRLDALIARGSYPSIVQGPGGLPEQQQRHQLREENQRLRRERDNLKEALRILASEAK